ncbi:MAG: nuclear transport factor 2 family protein [Egibacteraceae bacterium]
MEQLTAREVACLADELHRKLDVHAPVQSLLPLLAQDGFEIRISDGTFKGREGFERFYEGWIGRFFDETHEVKQLTVVSSGDRADVSVVVNWQARMWNPPEAKSRFLDIDEYQTWVVQRSPVSGAPVILSYIVDALKPMLGSDSIQQRSNGGS